MHALMKSNGKFLSASIMALALGAASSARAAIYALADLTRPAAGASINTPFDFTAANWSGTPALSGTLTPTAISGETSIYLTATVSWTANVNIGTFGANFYVNAGGTGDRPGVGTVGTGFGTIGGQTYAVTDPDGAGPATAAPTVAAVDKTVMTTVTLVIKIDQTKATPGGDYWFTNTALQSGAGVFMWINPSLGNMESSQPTNIAYWRSGQATYRGVEITTDTANVDLNFSNIRVYTGVDTPFSLVPEPSTALLGGLGMLALLRRRRA